MITDCKLHTAVDNIEKLTLGQRPLLTLDEEALAVACSKMKAAHGLPITRKMLGMKLKDMLGSLYPDKTRKQTSTLAYTRRVIMRVNTVEDERD